jgi:hypothetical protein
MTSNSSAPTNGRVSSVTAMIKAAATPTITTHLKTAASSNFIPSFSLLPVFRKYGRARKPSRSVDAGNEVRGTHY